ncbi:L,D-transpeptidase [Ktedonospora formicarum]|uniref:L,D-TPase catalytic domain-containing protein n=1 Tax=Ktedonospora formicarum TaxID=2778364 RepID=A0A8J3MQP7_9CHLR|nr:L,D-transpeptidase [Ktedonospora formicarum]GHO44185.1 hypothetical protein KSX_23480 [Ktedonospora formicarum]
MKIGSKRFLFISIIVFCFLLSIAILPLTMRAVHAQDNSNSESAKKIVVDISDRELVAYEGDEEVFDTLVTTGRKGLETPTGKFSVLQKLSPTTFNSPWPKGSPYYYPPTHINYALAFKDGGYFLHDATWITQFGPDETDDNHSSHGCVGMPLDAAKWLYNWAPIGTPVIIQP